MATITYNANGGYYAPAAQEFTSWTTITTATPSRSGYEFLGWARTPTASAVAYVPGATYSGGSVTLYAVWKLITYTITYNANGGEGAPAKQTKAWGAYDFYLSEVEPIRNNYEFEGWGTTSSTRTPSYQPGDRYIGNENLILYAIWTAVGMSSVSIMLFTVDRCTSSGTLSDTGTYAKVRVGYLDNANVGLDKITIKYTSQGSSSWTTAKTITSGFTPVTATEAIIGGSFSVDEYYTIRVELTDDNGTVVYAIQQLSSQNYVMDFYSGGTGLCIGGAATESGLDVQMASRFNNTASFYDEADFYNQVNVSQELRMGLASTLEASNAEYINIPYLIKQGGVDFLNASISRGEFLTNLAIENGSYLQLGNNNGTSFHNFIRMNEDNQFEMTWTSSYPMMGDMGTELWSGYWSPGSSITRTVSGASKYRVFLISLSGSSLTDSSAENGTWIIASRGYATYSTYRIAGGQNLADGNGKTTMYFVGVYFQATGNSWQLKSCGQLGVTAPSAGWSDGSDTNYTSSSWTSLGVTRIIGLI